jgi:hypothetical protein
MLFLLLSTTFLGLLLCGTGCLFAKALGFYSVRNPWIYFWLGFAVVSTLVMLTSLFVPINAISLIVFFALGAAGLPFFYREYKQAAARSGKAEIRITHCCIFVILIYIASSMAYSGWTGAYDTDLYHAQTIRWYNEYGTPPGLGNLHARLAFNTSWLSLAALFDNGIWDGRSAWLMPALNVLGGFLYFLHELFSARHNGVRGYAACILVWLLSLAGLLLFLKEPMLYYDNPAHVLNAIVVLEAYYILLGYTKNLSRKKIQETSNLLTLSASAFMIKPIGAVSLVFSGLLALFLLIRDTKKSVFSWIRICVPALCAIAIWVTKNIALSGYIMYPLPIFALPLDWAMPFEAVWGNYIDVAAWARMPGPGYRQSLENGFWFWFKPWLIGHLISRYAIVMAAMAVFPFFISAALWFFAFKKGNVKKTLWFLVWSLCAVAYWFITAPDIRFGTGFFWVCLAAAFLFVLPAEPCIDLSRYWKFSGIRIAFFCFLGVSIVAILGLPAVLPARNFLTIGRLQSRPVKEYVVAANPPFTVWIPHDGDDRTGNSPLPSTPYKPTNLEMRKPGNLGKGFRPIQRSRH